jgi:hypothetical protein
MIAPLLVLYTAGYRYNISTNSVTRTGVLSITTSIRNADIYLDGQYTQTKTPEVLKRIMPDEYSLELSKEGYHSWFGDIEVESGRTVQLQNVMLFTDTNPELLFNKDTQVLSVNPNGESIAYVVREGGWQETWLYFPQDNAHILIAQVIDAEDEVSLSWSAQGSYLLVFDITNESIQVFNDQGGIVETDYDDAIATAWHPSDDHLLSLTTNSQIMQLNLQNGSVGVLDQTSETSVVLDASILKLIDGDEFTEVAQYVGRSKETLALLPKATYTIQERDGTYLILIDSIGELYLIKIHEDEPILLKSDVLAYDWDENLDRLVYTDGFELSIYDARTHTTELVTRQSSMIQSVNWHPEADIIFVQDTGLRAFEAYAQAEQRYTTTLMDNADFQEIWISEDGETLYFYGTADGAYGVYQLQLTSSDPF